MAYWLIELGKQEQTYYVNLRLCAEFVKWLFSYCQTCAVWLGYKVQALMPFFCDVARQNVELMKQNACFYFGFSAFKFFCAGGGAVHGLLL